MNTKTFATAKIPPSQTVSLLLSCVAIMVIWLVVLPAVARWTPIRNHIQRMDQADIEVGAMFYTELNWDPPTGPVWR